MLGQFGSLGRGFGRGTGNGGAAATNDFFAATGSSMPQGVPPGSFPNVYLSGINETWFFYEAARAIYSTPQRVIECVAYNHTNGYWQGPNIVAINGAPDDDNHGYPVAIADTSGFVYVVYGEAPTAGAGAKWASNYVANNPTRWRDLTTTPSTATVFSEPRFIGSSLWHKYNRASVSDPTNIEGAVAINSATVSSGVPSWGSEKVLWDTDEDYWPIGAGSWVDGTDIHMCFLGCNQGATSNHHLYYMIYDTATGALRNFANSVSVASGSLPIDTATADTSFKIVDQTGVQGGVPSICLDGVGGTHVFYPQAPSTGSAGGPTVLKHIVNTGGGWSSVTDVHTYPNNTLQCKSARISIFPRAGGVDTYFSDASDASAIPTANGNMLRKHRSGAGVWGNEETILEFDTYGLNSPVAIISPHANARLTFSETSDDEETIAGDLKMYAYGDGGFLARPIITTYNSFAQDLFDRMSVVPNSVWLSAINTAMEDLESSAILYLMDLLYFLDAPASQSALLNWAQPAFDLTIGAGTPVFSAKRGFLYNGSNYHTSGFNPSSTVGRRISSTNCSIFAEFPSLLAAANGIGSFVSPNGMYMQCTSTQLITRMSTASNHTRTVGNGIGFYGASRQATSANINTIVNGSIAGPTSQAAGTMPNANWLVGGESVGTLKNQEVSFGAVGARLTDSQMTTLYNIRQAFVAAIASA